MFSNERSLGYIVCRKLSPLKPLKKEISTGTNLFELLSSFLWPLTPFLVEWSYCKLTFSRLDYAEIVRLFERNWSIYWKQHEMLSAHRGSTRDCVAFVMYILSNSTHHFHFHDQNMSVFHREKTCYVSKENFPYTCTKKVTNFCFRFSTWYINEYNL